MCCERFYADSVERTPICHQSNQSLKITAGLISEPCGQADDRECADDPIGGKVVETGERLCGVW